MENSHVVLSQLLMRGFTPKEKNIKDKVYYYDIVDGTIKIDRIKDIDSIFGYYDEVTEDNLSKIECKFGQVASKYKYFSKSKNNIYLSNDDIETIRLFFDLLLLRNKKIINKTVGLNHKTALQNYFNQKDDLSVFFSNYYPIVVCNLTNTHFLLPRCGIYIHVYDSIIHYVCPINHQTAIVMVDKNEFNNYMTNGEIKNGKITDDRIVEEMNLAAYYCEVETGKKYVIGNKKELEWLKNQIDTNSK